jgi:hypothetical protein
MKLNLQKVTNPLRGIERDKAMFAGTLVAVLTLGSVMTAWAGNCATPKLPLKASGGGYCQLIPNTAQSDGNGGWYGGQFVCSDGMEDHQIQWGGCIAPNDKSSQCKEAYATWTKNQYGTGQCDLNPIFGEPTGRGDCTISGYTNPSNKYGYSDGVCPSGY